MVLVAVHPRVGPRGTTLLWVGVTARAQPPNVRLEFVGSTQPVEGAWMRTLQRARESADAADRGQVWTGIFEPLGLRRGAAYAIRASIDDGTCADCTFTTPPVALPSPSTDERFNVLLVSCYYGPEDGGAALRTAVEALGPGRRAPHLALFVGDQVYLDLPTLEDFPRDERALRRKFEASYVDNWFDDRRLGRVLSKALSAMCPDDHEYWNNFPHKSPFVQNSWDAEGRRAWTAAARTMYAAFQLAVRSDQAIGAPLTFEIGELSFFVADTRSERDGSGNARRTQSARASAAFDAWIRSLDSSERFGVFVVGQPLLMDETGWLEGKVGDLGLPDHDDYGDIVRGLARARNDVLVLSGDVHWGRAASATNLWTNHSIHEVISSPSSLVTTIGKDHWKEWRSRLRSIFGERERWPRHGESEAVPDHLAPRALGGKTYSAKAHAAVRGDQATLLSFARSTSGVDVEIAPLSLDDVRRSPRPTKLTLKLGSKAHP